MSNFPLFDPPQFFKNVAFHRHTNRSIGWLELFYDLIYVATFIQLGNFLSDNVTLMGFAQFVVLLIVIWWAWTGVTFYQNRFVVDDLMHRTLIFIQIFAIAIIGLSVSSAFGDLYIQFTLAYIATRFILVLMYIRTYRIHQDSQDLTRIYIIGFTIGIFVWFGSLFLSAEYHWVGWLIGIGVELSVPFLPRMRQLQRQWSPDVHHISERFGIFTIILLGESFVKILDDSQGVTLGLNQIIFSIFGSIVTYSLWWLYFSDTADKIIGFASRVKPVLWIYGHLPLSAGLILFGVGAKKLFASTLDYPNDPLDTNYRLLYTVAIVLYLVGLALIDMGFDDEENNKRGIKNTWVHLSSAILITLIGTFYISVNAIVFVIIIASIMMIQIIYGIYKSHNEKNVQLATEIE